jgi:type II secretory pathway pseudopilin PulG
MIKNEGFALLRSLLTMAVVLICAAAFFAALAGIVRQSGQLGERLEEEMASRRSVIMERLR